jgi:hypothetical protein
MALADVTYNGAEKEVCFEALTHFHLSAIRLNEQLKNEEKKSFPVTPPSFLGMLHTYKFLLSSRRKLVLYNRKQHFRVDIYIVVPLF